MRKRFMRVEIWDVLDENGSPTGKTAVRGNHALKSGEFHLVVHIWIISSDGKFLIQKRAESRKLMPGEWAATGGSAISGESSFEAASRELYEEMGISSNRESLKMLTRIKRRNSLLDIWAIECNSPAEELSLQDSEVADAKWVEKTELEKMIEDGNFHNYGKEYFDIIFKEIENFRGVVV